MEKSIFACCHPFYLLSLNKSEQVVDAMKRLTKYLPKWFTETVDRQLGIFTIAGAVIDFLFGLVFFLVAGEAGWVWLLLWMVVTCGIFYFYFLFIMRTVIEPFREIVTKIDAFQPVDMEEGAKVEADELTRIALFFNRISTFIVETQKCYDTLVGSTSRVSSELEILIKESSVLEQSLGAAITDASNLKMVGEEMSQDAVNIVEVSKSSSNLSQKGVDFVTMSKNAMLNIRDAEASVLESNTKVNTYVNEVNEIISMVSDIASQSQLLAVNASIQAAKAGNAGRGFNIVAKEVKTLSLKSKQATQRAAEIIKNIRSAMSEMQNHVSEGNSRTRRGTDILEETGEIIAQLGAIISEISDVAYMISVSANEQTISLGDFNKTVAKLHAMSLDHRQGLLKRRDANLLREILAVSGELIQTISCKGTNAGAPFTEGPKKGGFLGTVD